MAGPKCSENTAQQPCIIYLSERLDNCQSLVWGGGGGGVDYKSAVPVYSAVIQFHIGHICGRQITTSVYIPSQIY